MQLRATDVHARTTTECEDRARSKIIKLFSDLVQGVNGRLTSKKYWEGKLNGYIQKVAAHYARWQVATGGGMGSWIRAAAASSCQWKDWMGSPVSWIGSLVSRCVKGRRRGCECEYEQGRTCVMGGLRVPTKLLQRGARRDREPLFGR